MVFVFPIYARVHQPVRKVQIRFPVLIYTGITGVCIHVLHTGEKLWQVALSGTLCDIVRNKISTD